MRAHLKAEAITAGLLGACRSSSPDRPENGHHSRLPPIVATPVKGVVSRFPRPAAHPPRPEITSDKQLPDGEQMF
jgi:hypothetical protein